MYSNPAQWISAGSASRKLCPEVMSEVLPSAALLLGLWHQWRPQRPQYTAPGKLPIITCADPAGDLALTRRDAHQAALLGRECLEEHCSSRGAWL